MIVVLGASGNIGSRAVRVLRDQGASVLAAVHSEDKAKAWEGMNVPARVVDVLDTGALLALFKDARRAFLLNPPADPSTDTDAAERATASSIAKAVEGSGLEKVVLVSAYGAQPGERIGDLSVLYELERRVEMSGVPTAINRGAYYFTNLDPLLATAKQGRILTPFPSEMAIPMVSPVDLGKAASRRLLSSVDDVGIQYVEGPERVTFAQVASFFSDALGQKVDIETTPRVDIEESFRQLGFSKPAADAYARMTKVSINGVELPDNPIRGSSTLREYIHELVQNKT